MILARITPWVFVGILPGVNLGMSLRISAGIPAEVAPEIPVISYGITSRILLKVSPEISIKFH